mmetsp:Transcript_11634/g.30737  ORF Transcript_11634/g.30737 Transcript_11634/m.30737 type:complete len:402 (+) Transcript_11634:231-1436(+)
MAFLLPPSAPRSLRRTSLTQPILHPIIPTRHPYKTPLSSSASSPSTPLHHILVFGSISADLVARVPFIPLPGETVLAPSYALHPGGKGANQATAAARIAAALDPTALKPVSIAGCLGDDAFSAFLKQTLEAAGVGVDGVKRLKGAASGVAMIAVDDAGENAIVCAQGANAHARADILDWAEMPPGSLLVVQMECPPREVYSAMRDATARGIRVVMNIAPFPKSEPPSREVCALCEAIVTNEIEAMSLLASLDLHGAPMSPPRQVEVEEPPRQHNSDQSASHVARSLLKASGARSVVVTLGARGAHVAVRGNTVGDCAQVWEVPTLDVPAVDSTGAGDAFVGALAVGIAAGWGVLDAAKMGAVAGALACTRIGAQSGLPEGSEVLAALARLSPLRQLGSDSN